MKQFSMYMIGLLAISHATLAVAQPVDILGGGDSSTQTVHHCGYLPTTNVSYTSSPVTTTIVQSKLVQLGYYNPNTARGKYDKTSKRAVKKFQRDYGLKVDGIVGPRTAQRLAYETHPSANVRRCFHMAGNV